MSNSLFSFAFHHYELYLLILLRMVAFVATSPLLSIQGWPNWSKLGLAVYLALSVSPTVSATIPSISAEPGEFILVALMESMTGMLMGFIATAVFAVASIAGQMADLSIGFSSATLFNPEMGQTSGLSSNVNNLLFTLFFIGMNGLNGLLLSVMNSYQFIPIGHFNLSLHGLTFIVQMLCMVMTLAVEMAAPLLSALLLTDITFAFMSRAVPQMNVFVVGLPAKLFVGLSLYATAMPGFVYLFGKVFDALFQQLNNLLLLLKG